MDRNDVQAELGPATDYREKFRCTSTGTGYIFFQMLNDRHPEGD
jgi:hypothetical protein